MGALADRLLHNSPTQKEIVRIDARYEDQIGLFGHVTPSNLTGRGMVRPRPRPVQFPGAPHSPAA